MNAATSDTSEPTPRANSEARTVTQRLKGWMVPLVDDPLVRDSVLVILLFSGLTLFSNSLPGLVRENLWHNRIQNLIITIASLFPYLLYRFFIGSRRPILDRDFRLNLQRLGLNSEDVSFTQRFVAVFGTESSLSLFIRGPLVLVSIILLVGWLFLFYQPLPLTNSRAVDFGPFRLNLNPITLGFLGAYVFLLQVLYSRYVNDDMKPALFVSIATRVLLVTFLAIGVFVAIPDTADSRLVYGAAFVVGIFPSAALRTLIQLASKVLALLRFESFDERLPLSQLDGMNIIAELRLNDENIHNIENMATADIVELLLQTRFPAERIIDWVDQALLQMHLGSSSVIEKYRDIHLRTASDLIDNYEHARRITAASQRTGLSAGTGNVDVALTLPDLYACLAKADPNMGNPGALESLIIALASDPNIYSIRYWRAHEHEILPRDANQLLLPGTVALLRGEAREAIRVYEDALRAQGRYPPIPFYLGLACSTAGRYEQAIIYFNQAIELNEPSRIPSAGSYYYYLSRGRAHLALASEHARNTPALSSTPATPNGTAALQSQPQVIASLNAAIADFKIATDVDNQRIEGLLLLGEALALDPQGREEASEVFQRAINLDQARVSLLTIRAFQYCAEVMAGFLNQYAQAAALLEEPMRDRHVDTDLLLLLGDLRFGLKQWDEAERAYGYAQALSPDAIRPALGVASVDLRRNQFNEAVLKLEQLVTARPNSCRALRTSARILENITILALNYVRIARPSNLNSVRISLNYLRIT